MSAQLAVDHYRSEFEVVEGQLPGRELAWLRSSRQGAIERFSDIGFPTIRHEDWKYTSLRAIEKRNFRPCSKSCVGLVEEDLDEFVCEHLECHRLVFINGQYAPQLSDPGRLPEGTWVGSLAKILTASPDLLEPYLGRQAGQGAFTALNTAFMADGACIYLPPNTVIKDPVHALFMTTSQQDEVFINPRNLVVAGDNSEVTVIESYTSLGNSSYFTNALTEISVGANASVTHYKLQQEGKQAFHVATTEVAQQRDSRFTSHLVSVGGQLVRNDINSSLDGERSECTLNGLYIAGGRQHMDFHTRVDHVKPQATSREYYKGILDGHARGVFNGRVYVHPDAQKSDAKQTNNNLLLSKDAEVDTKPQLEIYADDVKCAHGATVGQLDDDMIFYLRSRGLDLELARNLLVYGFAHDIIDCMDLPPLKERLETMLTMRLPGDMGGIMQSL